MNISVCLLFGGTLRWGANVVFLTHVYRNSDISSNLVLLWCTNGVSPFDFCHMSNGKLRFLYPRISISREMTTFSVCQDFVLASQSASRPAGRLASHAGQASQAPDQAGHPS